MHKWQGSVGITRRSRGGMSAQGRTFVGIGVLKLVHDMVMLSSPFVLQRLLQNLEDGGSRCASHWRPTRHCCDLIAQVEERTIVALPRRDRPIDKAQFPMRRLVDDAM